MNEQQVEQAIRMLGADRRTAADLRRRLIPGYHGRAVKGALRLLCGIALVLAIVVLAREAVASPPEPPVDFGKPCTLIAPT